MRLELNGQDRKFVLVAEDRDGKIIVDLDRKKMRVEFGQPGEGNRYPVRIDGRPLLVHLEEETGSLLTLTLDGETVTFRRPSVVGRGPRTPSQQATPAEANALHSPVTGKVISVQAAKGAVVEEGAPVVVIESMKMESVIRSDRRGRIREILVKVGGAVARGQALARFD